MELRHLRYFVAVAEQLNFTKAAERLRVAQPALSRQIRDLEEELGIALLERSSRFVRLTPAGTAFVGEARDVLRRAEEAARTARAFASGERGEVHLGYAPSPAAELLPLALRFFQDRCPEARIVLHDLTGAEMLGGLRAGRLDAALCVAPDAKNLRGLAFAPLRSYPFCLAVAPGHRLARGKSPSLAALRSERLLVYTRADYPDYHDMLAAMFAGELPEIAEEHDSATSLLAALESARGVAVVPSVLERLAGPRLKFRELAVSPPALVVGLAHRPKASNPAAAVFVQTVRGLTRTAPKA